MKKVSTLLLISVLCFGLLFAGCSKKNSDKVKDTSKDTKNKVEDVTGANKDKDKDKEEAKDDAKTSDKADKEQKEDDKKAEQPSDKKLKITVTTSFLADIVKQLVPEGTYEMEMIIPAGDDPHLYLAKPDDYNKINDADLVLYHGLHFEGKMIDILEKTGEAVTRDFKEDQLGEMEENGKVIIDPHFWFDLKLYQQAVTNAAESLVKVMPAQKEVIEKNRDKYNAELAELDKWAKAEIEKIPQKSRFLVTPHDAFNYFSRCYNIPVFAPQGVSTDSEVSTQDLLATVDRIIDNQIKAIFAESTTDPARMEKLKEACKQKGFEVKVVSGEDKELFSDSLAAEGHPGDTFVDMFRHNVELIVNNLK